jgi:hypothetical protein
VARNVEISTRPIKDFGEKELFVGGDVVDTASNFLFPPTTSQRARFLARDGATRIQVVGRKPVGTIAP